MKKVVYIIFGFVIGAILTYYFCPRSIEIDTTEVNIVKPKGVSLSFCSSNRGKNALSCYKVSIVGNLKVLR